MNRLRFNFLNRSVALQSTRHCDIEVNERLVVKNYNAKSADKKNESKDSHGNIFLGFPRV